MTKVATKKTAGVLGDDLALNAEQVSGVRADRELPVVWAVAKGSARNKAILIPIALVLSAAATWAVTPLLMIGGAFLCFEGFEKVAHPFLSSHKAKDSAHTQVTSPSVVVESSSTRHTHEKKDTESEKIKGAVRTDFILSAEIIVISLGSMKTAAFMTQVIALFAVGVIMTVGVYGLVAGIVKLDDAGLALSKRGGLAKRLGLAILWAAPRLMKLLSFVGTLAMFLVGGGILVHGVPQIKHASKGLALLVGPAGAVVATLFDALTGVVTGAVLVAFASVVSKIARSAKTRD